MANIEINGKKIEVELGSMIIEAADTADIWIPRFCYHKKLSIAANCRMCLVEVEKSGKPLPACATPVSDGMKVWTRSPKAIQAQKSVMEFLLINHPLDCPICDQGGECELQDLSMGYGQDHSKFTLGKRSIKDKDIGPLIATDMTRCIQCTRCVRFGTEVAGVRELGAYHRGEHLEIGTFIEHVVESEVSGNIIDLCPVGALTSKPYRFKARGFELTQKPGVAPHDCVGSNIFIHTRRDEVMRVIPKENESINEIWLSDRDRFSYEAAQTERLTHPKIKVKDHWETVSWEQALQAAKEGLLKASGKLGALASPNSTTEEFYLLQKLMRGLGSHHIDHRLRQMDFREQDKVPNYPHAGISIAELETQSAILLIGSDIRAEQPLLGLKLRKAALAGAKVFCINPIDFPMHFEVTNKIIVEGGDLYTRLCSIAKALVQEVAHLPPWFEEVKVTPLASQFAKQLLETENAAVLLGTLGLHHPEASRLMTIANFISQCIGGSFGVLTDGANSAGGWIAGALPHRLPGGKTVDSPGFNAVDLCTKPLHTLVLMNIDPDLDCVQGAALTSTMHATACVIALTPFISPMLLDHADILLPMCPFTENSGSFVNMEGVWQTFSAATPPLHESRPAWKILRVLGNLCGLEGFDYVSQEDVLLELKTSSPHSPPSLAWKLDVTDDYETSRYFQKTKEKSENNPIRIGLVPSFSADNLVRRSPPLQSMQSSAAALRLNSTLAHHYGIMSDTEVQLKIKGITVKLPVIIDPSVPNHTVIIPMGIPETVSLGTPYEPVEIQRV